MELREALERATPLRREIAPDWPDVVRRARPRRRLRPALALAAALAAAAFATVALWPSSSAGVLQRALGAVGAGPIVHVVYRDETHEALVDLSTGAETPLYYETEEWYAPGDGLKTISRFGGHAVSEAVVAPAHVSQLEQQTGAVLLDGYRAALAAGTATVVGDGTVAGHDVTWIAFRPEQLPDVGDGRVHAFAEQVAVDRSTYRPVYVRFARDGVPTPGTGEEIRSLETLPAGSVDFTPRATAHELIEFGVQLGDDITADVAAAGRRVLGTPPLVPAGGQLASAHTAAFVNGPVSNPERAQGVVLCYEAGCALRLEETTDAAALQLGAQVPDGSLLTSAGSRQAVVHRGALYVRILGRSDADVLAAARALQEANVSR